MNDVDIDEGETIEFKKEGVKVEMERYKKGEQLWRMVELYFQVCGYKMKENGNIILIEIDEEEYIRIKKETEGVTVSGRDMNKMEMRIYKKEDRVRFEIGKMETKESGNQYDINLEILTESKTLGLRNGIYLNCHGNKTSEKQELVIGGLLVSVTKVGEMKVLNVKEK